MRKGIILVTKHFPFNKGETPAESYLENEIKTLAQGTKKVFVIATEAKQNAEVTCTLPPNVECVALQNTNSKLVKLACCAKATIMFFRKKPEEVKQEIKQKKLSFSKKMFLYYYIKRSEQKLKKIEDLEKGGALKLSDYDTLYSYWFFDSAHMLAKLKEKYSLSTYRLVSRAHGYDLYEERNRLNYIPLRKYFFENSNGVFACSNNGRNYLVEKYPEFTDKILVSYLGSLDYSQQAYIRKNGALRIASCSRLIPLKRVDRIIDALALLEKKNIELEWIHFGDGTLFEEIKAKAESKLKKTKYTLRGNVPNTEVMREYTQLSTDVFVNVSTSEGLPISIMEATSFGIPVIATDVGGTSEIVSNGKNGFLLDKDFTDEELCDLLNQIATMPDDEYCLLRQSSRNIYMNNFECKQNVKRFLSYIED